jgi:uncharacterized protein (UPF0332 family)
LSPFDPLLEKAEKFITSAEMLAGDGDFDSAASSLYYSMFFKAEGLLAARDLTFSSHCAVISAYGQYFAKTKELDPKLHQPLLNAFSQRQLVDYTVDSGLTHEDIDILLAETRAFQKAAREKLESS